MDCFASLAMTDDGSSAAYQFVIAGLDPAIHRFSKKMNTRV